MPVVRIFVDGYSLLHSRPELARGKPRHSEAARDELVRRVSQYADATATPVTVVFDGTKAPQGLPKPAATPGVEILFSKAGRTADDLIERAVSGLRGLGEVLVVTDDFAERETVLSLGATALSCAVFWDMLQLATRDLRRDLERYNRREQARLRGLAPSHKKSSTR